MTPGTAPSPGGLAARVLAVLARDTGRTDDDLAGLLGVTAAELSPVIGRLYRQGRADRCGPYIVAVPPPRCPACEYRLPAHAYDCPALPEPDGTDDAIALLARPAPWPGSGKSGTSGTSGTCPGQRRVSGFPRPGEVPEPPEPPEPIQLADQEEATMTRPDTAGADDRQRLAEVALWCAARGWPVFPIRPRAKKPPAVTGWEDRATTDPARIRACWAHGPYNVGIATGPARLVVVDLDKPKPGQTPPAEWAQPGIIDGADVLAVLCERHGQPWPGGTFTVRTGRGGLHLYFTAPPGLALGNTAGSTPRGLGWLIDTRARGGYVVAPGSVVDSSGGPGRYEIACDQAPAVLPDWLAGLLNPARHPHPPIEGRSSSPDQVRVLPAYARTALYGESERVRAAAVGGRSHALNKAAYKLGRLIAAGALPEDLASRELYEAASVHFAADPPLTPAEARAAIRCGIAAGKRKPRQLAVPGAAA